MQCGRMADSFNYPWKPKRGRYTYCLPWEREGAGRKGCLVSGKVGFMYGFAPQQGEQ